jgi:hypothetical protein
MRLMGVFSQGKGQKFFTRFPVKTFAKMMGIVEDDISQPDRAISEKRFNSIHKSGAKEHQENQTSGEVFPEDEHRTRNYYLDNIT